MNLGWPDLIVLILLVLFGTKGWRRGFVDELAGFVALAIAVVAAFRYDGVLDGFVGHVTHLGPGSSHVIGMVLYAAIVYAALMMLAAALSRIARLPVVGIVNAAGGAAVGVFKTLLALWALVYVALFFPLTPDLRADLRHSTSIALLESPNARVDDIVKGALPWLIRPFVFPIFDHHRV